MSTSLGIRLLALTGLIGHAAGALMPRGTGTATPCYACPAPANGWTTFHEAIASTEGAGSLGCEYMTVTGGATFLCNYYTATGQPVPPVLSPFCPSMAVQYGFTCPVLNDQGTLGPDAGVPSLSADLTLATCWYSSGAQCQYDAHGSHIPNSALPLAVHCPLTSAVACGAAARRRRADENRARRGEDNFTAVRRRKRMLTGKTVDHEADAVATPSVFMPRALRARTRSVFG